ncbi:MAG: Nif3-like dinuclear metal center hexameric protein [Campylobacterota bacterium]
MKLSDIYNLLDSVSPFELQEKWDNCGINVGDINQEIERIYVTLDFDTEYLNNVLPNSLIITHHPLLISPIKSFNFEDRSSKLLKELIKKDIAVIAMHTNIDKSHLNDYVVRNVFGFDIEAKKDFIAYVSIEKSFDDIVAIMKNKLGVENIKTVKTKEYIKTLAVTTGSGMSLLGEIKADCFLTGDIKYHDALEAKDRGISLIDIGHYESERYFCDLLESILVNDLKINEIMGIISKKDFKNPFEYN